jgi:uncharacterized protein (TIGR02145 family)
MKKIKKLLFVGAFAFIASCGSSETGDTAKSDNTTDSTATESANSHEVSIGKQIWMTENLNVDKFRNGEPIPQAKTDDEWYQMGENKQPAWCYYNNNPDNGDRYNKLYNWYAVVDPRGLAPKGWKIPSKEDWNRLIDFLGGADVAGNKMKFTDFWADNEGKSGSGKNESGFSGLPGGFRSNYGSSYSLGSEGCWWSTNDINSHSAFTRSLNNKDGVVKGDIYYKAGGLSVRCVKDK